MNLEFDRELAVALVSALVSVVHASLQCFGWDIRSLFDPRYQESTQFLRLNHKRSGRGSAYETKQKTRVEKETNGAETNEHRRRAVLHGTARRGVNC
jgi:hypothetical protein